MATEEERCAEANKFRLAVAERNPLAVQALLDGGADPELRTRIDECETPLEMAQAAGFADIVALLTRKRK